MDTPSPALSRTILLGLLAGLMAGLFGVGGGIVLVPGLVLLGVDQHRAHATSLAAIIITAPAALTPFAIDGAVSWPAAAALAVGALLGAIGGADVMTRIPADRLRGIFGGFMLLIAVRLVLPGGGGTSGSDVAVALGAAGVVGLGLAGVATGALSALLGVGGGIVMVPVMVIGFGFGQHLAEGTSLAVIIPTALVGAWRHTRNGYTMWRVGLTVGAGGIIGGLAGGTLAQSLPADLLQAAFAVLLVVAGVRLLRHGRRTPQIPVQAPGDDIS